MAAINQAHTQDTASYALTNAQRAIMGSCGVIGNEPKRYSFHATSKLTEPVGKTSAQMLSFHTDSETRAKVTPSQTKLTSRRPLSTCQISAEQAYAYLKQQDCQTYISHGDLSIRTFSTINKKTT
ncbi:hypothetical protein D5018_18730 [Parashewanella curva]|uniref:Uncharacterized protein n=1 Tax=Parashewanella curva TaxID=2338552 RepID=A0A3L8PRY2_9GAMM|nr:hypothetical protein [Parashewanella curva]RLV58177.1 hypothetical protein D5018_18730 [Parashewanella curva]